MIAGHKKPKRKARAPQESRRLLVEAAAKIFNSVGFHGTDTNRIAKAAGYAPTTFYTHFPDKRAIFVEVYENWVDAELDDIAAGFRSKGPDQVNRLAKTILNHHKRWKVFRASLRALYAIDSDFRRSRLAQRSKQVDAMIAIANESGRKPQSRAHILCNLLMVEAISDAIADGDLKITGVRDSEMFARLIESVGRLRG